MKAADPRASLDLTATLALSLLGLLVALLSDAVWLRTAVLLPMVLVLPGYALCAALLPTRSLPAAERATYVVALSIASTALSGVVVQLFVGLDRTIWALTLFGLVVGASAVALGRRQASGAIRGRPALRGRLDPASWLAIAAAIAIAAWAISISSEGAREEREKIGFTELWALPEAEDDGDGGDSISIGVVNDEGKPVSYRLRASQAGDTVASWRVELDDGDNWQASLPAPPISAERPLTVALFRDGEVYRRAVIRDRDLES